MTYIKISNNSPIGLEFLEYLSFKNFRNNLEMLENYLKD